MSVLRKEALDDLAESGAIFLILHFQVPPRRRYLGLAHPQILSVFMNFNPFSCKFKTILTSFGPQTSRSPYFCLITSSPGQDGPRRIDLTLMSLI